MHIHILGIGGTFMGGIALLARAAGHTVSGSDSAIYPPMSTQLAEQDIAVHEGYAAAHLQPAPDCVVVGNVMTRGNAAIEYLLAQGLPYTSGPQWLAEHVLQGRWVLAVAGTHGKTSTASLLAWLLEHAGLNPGFLIGGVPENFGVSARLGATPFFVVEADEYDTAFFDKRSKFVHYRPRTLILNNLEYDHADIFPDLAAIQRQFHHLMRTVPGNGLVVANGADAALAAVLDMGCWTPVEYFDAPSARWRATPLTADASRFEVHCDAQMVGTAQWALIGAHNTANALAAIAAARHVGVLPAQAIEALKSFRNVKRRLQIRGVVGGVTIYDDFAHHPTAIATTLAGLRGRVGDARIIAVLELRSNTMRLGVHKEHLPAALAGADQVLFYQPADLGWDLQPVILKLGSKAAAAGTIDELLRTITTTARPGDHVLIMSNGSFGGIHDRLLAALAVFPPSRSARERL